MTIPVRFEGGPLHKMDGQISQLDPILLFFDKRQRQVLAYQRTDELLYTYEVDMSQALTTNYDDAFEKFGSTDSPVSWKT